MVDFKFTEIKNNGAISVRYRVFSGHYGDIINGFGKTFIGYIRDKMVLEGKMECASIEEAKKKVAGIAVNQTKDTLISEQSKEYVPIQ